MTHRVKLIFNPTSGRYNSQKKISQLISGLEEANFEVDIYKTQYAGDATREAAETTSDYYAIIAAGGDGTLNEVSSGLVNREIPMAFFPIGTANILQHCFYIPSSPQFLVNLLQKPEIFWMDMAKIQSLESGEETYFLQVFSIGFDVEIVKHVKSKRKGHSGGYRKYFWPILKQLFTYSFPKCTLIVDQKEITKEASIAFLGNVSRYGGPLKVTHRAFPNDGLLDLTLASKNSRWTLLKLGIGALTERLPYMKDVEYYRGTVFEFLGSSEISYQVDGEYMGELPIRVEILPKALPLMLPSFQTKENE